ncbi:hypothetical protein ABK040_013847 [Willaertia magna]
MFGELFALEEGIDDRASITNGNNSSSNSTTTSSSKGAKMPTLDSLQRQKSNFVGLKNQGATCYLNSLIQTLFMTPPIRSSFLKLNLEKEFNRMMKPNELQEDDFEEIKVDFKSFPYYNQLLDMGFESEIINKSFHKFVQITDVNNTEISTRTQENMLMWLFEEQERRNNGIEEEEIVINNSGNSDNEITSILECNVNNVVDKKKIIDFAIIKKEKKRKPNLLFVLQKLFSTMMKIEKPSIETLELTDAFGWSSKHVHIQHDIQELSRVFFQALETKLSKMKCDNFIKNNYCGKFINKIVCQECGYTSSREEEFYDLTITVENSLKESLDKYISYERFEGNNKYECSRCNRKVELALRNTTIKELPPILIFSLSRFEFDWKTESRIKIKKEMTFDSLIDMKPYLENQETDDATTYELISVIIHSGSAYAGHYYCFVHDFLNEGNFELDDEITTTENNKKKKNKKVFETEDGQHWFECNDERVFPINHKEEIPKYFGGKGATAYMLVYKKKSLDFDTKEFIIPKYLLNYIDEENKKIQTLREYQIQQYDISRHKEIHEQNSLTIAAYLPQFFNLERNGILIPSNLQEITKYYRSFSFLKDLTINYLHEEVRERFGQKIDNFNLYLLKKVSEHEIYVIDKLLPKHDDDDDRLLQEYCDNNNSKVVYVIILPNDFFNNSQEYLKNTFNNENPMMSFDVLFYETPTDTRTTCISNCDPSISLENVIQTAKFDFNIDVDVDIYLNYFDKEPVKCTIEDLSNPILISYKGCYQLSIELKENQVSYCKLAFEQKKNTSKKEEELEDSIIVKFGDNDKIIKTTTSNHTLLDFKKKLLTEMFEYNNVIKEKLKTLGDVWVRENILLKKPKKEYFKSNQNDLPLVQLDLTDGDRLELFILIDSTKEIEIQFIEILANDTLYEEKDYQLTPPKHSITNRFTLTVNQDITLKQCKTKLSQKFKKVNQLYSNIYNFRLRTSLLNNVPGAVIKNEEMALTTALLSQQDNRVLFVELERPPFEGLIKVKVNTFVDFPPKTTSSIILNEDEEHIPFLRDILANEQWTLQFLKEKLLEIEALSHIESILHLQVRDVTFDGGFKRPKKVYSDTFHLNKTLGKLKWKDSKVIVVKEVEPLKYASIDNNNKQENGESKGKRNKKNNSQVQPPPLYIIVRLREQNEKSEFIYSKAIEILVTPDILKQWIDLPNLFKYMLHSLKLDYNSEDIVVSKYSFSDQRIIRIEADKDDNSKEEKEKEQKKKNPPIRRISLTDGDVLIVSLKSNLEIDPIMKNYSLSLEQYEIEKGELKRDDDDLYDRVFRGERSKEVPLQIFIDDDDEEEVE